MSDRDAAFTSWRKDMWEGVSVDQYDRKVRRAYLVNMTGSRYSKDVVRKYVMLHLLTLLPSVLFPFPKKLPSSW